MSRTINEAGVATARSGDAPSDIASRQFVSASSQRRTRRGDVAGDSAAEVLVELEDQHGVEILSASGQRLGRLPTADYLTDFGAIAVPGSDKQSIVLYAYPNANRGGTFSVVTAGGDKLSSWDELPPPAGFAVGQWSGMPAVFYLQGEQLVIRSPQGHRITTLDAPQGGFFTVRAVRSIASGRTVVLASGNGYTPYHVVCIYDSGGRLIFERVGDEQAFELGGDEGDGAQFFVSTRSSRWTYTTDPRAPR